MTLTLNDTDYERLRLLSDDRLYVCPECIGY